MVVSGVMAEVNGRYRQHAGVMIRSVNASALLRWLFFALGDSSSSDAE